LLALLIFLTSVICESTGVPSVFDVAIVHNSLNMRAVWAYANRGMFLFYISSILIRAALYYSMYLSSAAILCVRRPPTGSGLDPHQGESGIRIRIRIRIHNTALKMLKTRHQ
jgi:hypothetical protein